MEKIFLVLVFSVGLLFRVSTAAGAELELQGAGETANPEAGTGFLVASRGSSSNAVFSNGDSNEEESADDEDVDAATARRELGKSSNTRIQNNIVVGQNPNSAENAMVARGDGGTLVASVHESRTSSPVALIPMIGGSGYQGAWYSHINNTVSFGLALEFTLSSVVALELEGDYGKYNISYVNYKHDFHQYSYGGNTKLYLSRGVLQPFIGAGVMGVTYQNMTHGPTYPYSYNDTIGAGQLLAGTDIVIAKDIALGVRGSYLIPLFSRPPVASNGPYAYPYFEEASAMDSAFYRLMASIKFSL